MLTPQVQHLHMVHDVVSPRLGPQQMVGQPMELARTPSSIVRSALRRGEPVETQTVIVCDPGSIVSAPGF